MKIEKELLATIRTVFPIKPEISYTVVNPLRDAALAKFRKDNRKVDLLLKKAKKLYDERGLISRKLATEFGLSAEGYIQNEERFRAAGGHYDLPAHKPTSGQIITMLADMDRKTGLAVLKSWGVDWT